MKGMNRKPRYLTIDSLGRKSTHSSLREARGYAIRGCGKRSYLSEWFTVDQPRQYRDEDYDGSQTTQATLVYGSLSDCRTDIDGSKSVAAIYLIA